MSFLPELSSTIQKKMQVFFHGITYIFKKYLSAPLTDSVYHDIQA